MQLAELQKKGRATIRGTQRCGYYGTEAPSIKAISRRPKRPVHSKPEGGGPPPGGNPQKVDGVGGGTQKQRASAEALSRTGHARSFNARRATYQHVIARASAWLKTANASGARLTDPFSHGRAHAS